METGERTAHCLRQHGAIFPVHGHGEIPWRRLFRLPPARYLGLAIARVPQHIGFCWFLVRLRPQACPAGRLTDGTASLPTTCIASKPRAGSVKQYCRGYRQKTGTCMRGVTLQPAGNTFWLCSILPASRRAITSTSSVCCATTRRIASWPDTWDMPRGASPCQHHGAHCHQNHAQHPRPGHMPGRSFERLCGAGRGAWCARRDKQQHSAVNCIANPACASRGAHNSGLGSQVAVLGIRAGDGSKVSSKYNAVTSRARSLGGNPHQNHTEKTFRATGFAGPQRST